jgi:hypothetical protein
MSIPGKLLETYPGECAMSMSFFVWANQSIPDSFSSQWSVRMSITAAYAAWFLLPPVLARMARIADPSGVEGRKSCAG